MPCAEVPEGRRDKKQGRGTQMEKDYYFTGYNSSLCDTARMLRKNMTKQERHLWYDYLKNCSPRWLRQRVIDQYIVDFYCSKAKLIVELDGSQHYTVSGEEYDSVRTEVLEQYGLEVIRFSNDEIDRRFNDSCRFIEEKIKERTGKYPVYR